MAKISLICEQCGGNIILDNSHEIGTCESCFSQFVIKQDQIIQKITQNITKKVYGYQGKDIEELIEDGNKLIDLGDPEKANAKFRKAVEIEPECWEAWNGFAVTGGDRSGYLSFVPAFRKAYSIARTEEQEATTYVDMLRYIPDQYLRSVFIRAFNMASKGEQGRIFNLVSRVIGCDDSEIGSLALDLCPDDWHGYFAMTRFRQIRTQWCQLEGNFITGKHLPAHAQEVLNLLLKAYHLAEKEGPEAKETVQSYIQSISAQPAYKAFSAQLVKKLK